MQKKELCKPIWAVNIPGYLLQWRNQAIEMGHSSSNSIYSSQSNIAICWKIHTVLEGIWAFFLTGWLDDSGWPPQAYHLQKRSCQEEWVLTISSDTLEGRWCEFHALRPQTSLAWGSFNSVFAWPPLSLSQVPVTKKCLRLWQIVWDLRSPGTKRDVLKVHTLIVRIMMPSYSKRKV